MVFRLRAWVLVLVLGSVAACGARDAQPFQLQTDSGLLDLAAQLPGDWDRVCILTPYMTTERASELLGFWYSPVVHSAIAVRDDISLLVTALYQKPVGAYEILRSNADFATLSARCYPRSSAQFFYEPTGDGWHRLVPQGRSQPEAPR